MNVPALLASSAREGRGADRRGLVRRAVMRWVIGPGASVLVAAIASACGDSGSATDPLPAASDAGAEDPRGPDGLWSMEECKRENALLTLECAALGSVQWITAGPKLGCQGVSAGAGGRFSLDIDATTSVIGLRIELNPDDAARVESILFEAPSPMPADRLALAEPISWKASVRPAPIAQRFGAFGFVEARFTDVDLRLSGPSSAADFGPVAARGRFTASRAVFDRYDPATGATKTIDDPAASVEACFHLATKVVARR